MIHLLDFENTVLVLLEALQRPVYRERPRLPGHCGHADRWITNVRPALVRLHDTCPVPVAEQESVHNVNGEMLIAVCFEVEMGKKSRLAALPRHTT